MEDAESQRHGKRQRKTRPNEKKRPGKTVVATPVRVVGTVNIDIENVKHDQHDQHDQQRSHIQSSLGCWCYQCTRPEMRCDLLFTVPAQSDGCSLLLFEGSKHIRPCRVKTLWSHRTRITELGQELNPYDQINGRAF
jgi:hypothetical protein